MGRIKVVYIAGSNRCGSTLLARLLGDIPHFFAIGEGLLHFFYGSSQTQVPCGCGLDVHECAFWKGVLFPSEKDQFALDSLRLRRLGSFPSFLRREPKQAERVINSVRDFYHSIAERTGAKVIIDSSKNPCHARLLDLVPDLDLYLIHLIRDPRGVAASNSQQKEWLPASSPLGVTVRWLGLTLGTAYVQSQVSNSRTLRYEDFVKEPRSTILDIVCDLGFNAITSSFLNDSMVELGPQHMRGSNPDKMRRGPTRVADRSRDLPWHSSAMISVLAAPALWRYGYLGPEKPAHAAPVSSKVLTSFADTGVQDEHPSIRG